MTFLHQNFFLIILTFFPTTQILLDIFISLQFFIYVALITFRTMYFFFFMVSLLSCSIVVGPYGWRQNTEQQDSTHSAGDLWFQRCPKAVMHSGDVKKKNWLLGMT